MSDDARRAVIDRLVAVMRDHAADQAIEFVDATAPDARVWWTWGDVRAVGDALARLVDASRVPPDAAIALVMRQRPAMVACELATLASGRTALLVTPLVADMTLAGEVAAVAPAVLVAHRIDWARPGFADAAAGAGSLAIEVDDAGALTVRHVGSSVPDGPRVHGAVTVLTSGTTGTPKRLPVPWDTFVRLGGGAPGRAVQSARGALILSLPLVTLGGLFTMARLVFGGRPMALLEPFEVHAWAALVKEHRPSAMGAPPPVVQMILDADISADHFDGVEAYLTGSAALAPGVIRRFEARYGIPVLVGYGATEFLGSVTGWTADLWAAFGRTKVGSVGRPHAGVGLRVLDPASLDGDAAEVAVGAEGILEVDPPERAGGLPAGWLRTSDRARIDADGFVWILGRADDVIVRGGFKVDLATVERALREHPDVVDAAAVGLPDGRLGQVPGALVVLAPGAPAAPDALAAWLRDRLPPYAVPTVIRLADAIPQTSTFKPHRVEIAHLLTGRCGGHGPCG